MERRILQAALSSREIFDQLENIEVKENLSDTGKIIYDYIKDYYERDSDADVVDIPIVASRVYRAYPRQEDTFKSVFALIEDTKEGVSGINILQECVDLAEKRIGLQLSGALLESSKEVPKLIEQYVSIKDKVEGAINGARTRTYTNIPLDDLFTEGNTVPKIKLLPTALNDRIGGGLESGDNVLVYARPEIGKSLFTINAVCGFLVQGYKVLYYGNEDPAQRMLRRVVVRLTGLTRDEIINDPVRASALAERRNYSLFTFVKGENNTFAELRQKLDEFEPQILVIDQLRHMVTGNDNRVIQLEEAANEARRIGTIYDIPVINVTQAGDSAEGRLNLGQGDVDFSNTGIPGAMDLMIGIGANEEYLNRHMRRISLPKNKLNNDHSSFDVIVNEQLSKIVE